MPTFPKAERFYSTPIAQPSRIPVCGRRYASSSDRKTPSIIKRPIDIATGGIEPDNSPSPAGFMFDGGSNAGHTPHPASRGVSPQAVSELQVRRDLEKILLTLFLRRRKYSN